MSRLRWQQAEGRRHALDDYPMPDVPFTALCGATVTPKRSDFAELGSLWLDPTCGACHDAWIDREGLTGVLRWGEAPAGGAR